MKIQQIRYKSPFFGKPRLIVSTSQGEGDYPIQLSKHYSLKDINTVFSQMEFKKIEDFKRIKEKLPKHDERMIKALQLASFNAHPQSWKFFTEVKQVPRPMHVLLKKRDGTEFLSFSLDASGFEKATLANQQLKEAVEKELKEGEKLSTKDILTKISETLKKINLSFDLQLKLGVNFAKKESKENVAQYIEEFKLTYAENISKEGSLEDYQELSGKYRESCFIVMPYTNLEEADLKNSNAVILEYLDLQELPHIVDALEEKQMNIFYKVQKGEEELAVALRIPIVKISEDADIVLKRLTNVKDKLQKQEKK